jgi:phospholipid transport system substrate-binding protein
MGRWPNWVSLAGVLLLGFAVAAPRALAGEPLVFVRDSSDRIIQTLKDKDLKSQPELREQKLWELISTWFDFEEMARRTLAVHWRERTPAEQKEFIELFSRLLQRSYLSKIEQYTDEKIEYLGEEITGQRASVKTKLIGKSMEIPIEYHLMQKGANWSIYDVVIEGVSLINNYRNQFNRIIVSSGYKELVKRMRTKWDELIKESDKQRKEST